LLKQDLYNVLSNPAGQCQCQYRRKKNWSPWKAAKKQVMNLWLQHLC
jgi:hypothetical protein